MNTVSAGGVLKSTRLKLSPLSMVTLRDSVSLPVGVTTMVPWLAVIFLCCLLGVECKGFDIYPDTPRGDSINMCAGEGTRRVICDYTGKWVFVDGECCKVLFVVLMVRLPCCRRLGCCSREYQSRTFLRFSH